MHTGWERIRRAFCALAALFTLPLVRWLIRCAGGQPARTGGEGEQRPPLKTGCQSIPALLYRRPDPLIYDQYYLMAQGLAVTWDNPDVRVEQNGAAVSAHNLAPATTYDVIATVWNGSTDAPAANLPVHFSYLTFGVGTTKTAIGTTTVDLGVKGSSDCPAFARLAWTTPETPGHYCLQVELDWPDDANPANNLGQHNISVQPLNSPRATFAFAVRNPTRRPLMLALRADSYAIPGVRLCRDTPASAPEQPEQERTVRLRQTLATHGQDTARLPEGWDVVIAPTELRLGPDETREVSVIANAPDGFSGRQPLNVNAFTVDNAMIGGVTLYAEGTA